VADSGASGILINTTPNDAGPFLGNRITANRVIGGGRVLNSSQISIQVAQGTLVQGNVAIGRRLTPGVFVQDSSAMAVDGNVLQNNNEGVLVRGNSSNTSVSSNQATQNQVGIVVGTPATGTLVSGNAADVNAIDGINVGAPATTITANSANSNGRWGIAAVSGVTDGGGNRAAGNGNPAQCTPNIHCV